MKEYKFNKEWLNKLLEVKDNDSVWLSLSDNDTRILLTYIGVLQSKIDKALDKILKCKTQLFNEIPTWLDELENILKGEDK